MNEACIDVLWRQSVLQCSGFEMIAVILGQLEASREQPFAVKSGKAADSTSDTLVASTCKPTVDKNEG